MLYRAILNFYYLSLPDETPSVILNILERMLKIDLKQYLNYN